MEDKHLWDVEINTPSGWMIVAESITYAEYLRRFGNGDYAEFRLWTPKER